jgi:hypothetical protein
VGGGGVQGLERLQGYRGTGEKVWKGWRVKGKRSERREVWRGKVWIGFERLQGCRRKGLERFDS